jgi:hypothetical protein
LRKVYSVETTKRFMPKPGESSQAQQEMAPLICIFSADTCSKSINTAKKSDTIINDIVIYHNARGGQKTYALRLNKDHHHYNLKRVHIGPYHRIIMHTAA